MKKKIIYSSIVLLFFVFSPLSAQVKVAFVDSDVIIGQLPEAQAIKKKIEDLTKQYQDTVASKENDIKTKADDFKSKYEDAQKQVEAGTLKPDEIKLLESQISQMQQEIQKMDQDLTDYKQGIQQVLLQTQQALFKPVKEKITTIIEQVAKELKFSMVFDKAGDAVLYGDKDLDITFKVLDKLK
ncbi:MAG: OmpH family outer membrane protein [Ignavibacteria bacterium]